MKTFWNAKDLWKVPPERLKKQEKKKKLSGHFLLPFFHDNEKNTEGVYLTFLSSVRFISTLKCFGMSVGAYPVKLVFRGVC